MPDDDDEEEDEDDDDGHVLPFPVPLPFRLAMYSARFSLFLALSSLATLAFCFFDMRPNFTAEENNMRANTNETR